MNKKEGIGNYKLGQKVAIYGYIDAINIENRNDIENTTTLEINTPVKTISVNPKYEVVTTDLDKPKPVVPQYVADWYKDIKDNFYLNLEYRVWDKFEMLAVNNNCVPEKPLSDDFTHWYYNTKNAIQILINMHQFGYEIEKEKLYTVEIPNPNSKGHNKIYLCKDDTTGKVYLCKGTFNPKKNKNLKLTEAEIRKDFEWAWQWAKEVL